jgi:ABC-type multidrug transport system ATPase subunit
VVRNLQKRYPNGIWANRDISIIGNPGEILGILGPNGAGKTTLVRQITTELLPTSGSIEILGLDAITDSLAVKTILGTMPQGVTLFGYLTVYQHIRIFGKLRGLSAQESVRRTNELIEQLELTKHRDVPVEKLSGGLMRRVLVAIASLAYPPVMVLDEPTTGLDPQSRRSLWALLQTYRENGTFILLTTHSMEEAETLCDRVGIIKDGRLLKLDTILNLRSELEYEFKVSYLDNDTHGDSRSIYGLDEEELVSKVREMGIKNLFSFDQG